MLQCISTTIQTFFNIFFDANKSILNLFFDINKEFSLFILFYFLALIALIYIIIILCLTYFFIKKQKQFSEIKYISVIKDREYLIFKNNLFKFYYTFIVILFYFLFKHNFFYLILDLNIFLLTFIFYFSLLLVCYSTSNSFILFLFNIYLNLKYLIDTLDNIKYKFKFKVNFNKLSMSALNLQKQTRSFSTTASIGQNLNYINPEADKLRKEILENPTKAGCFEYTLISNLGNVNEFYSTDPSIKSFVEQGDKLIARLKVYINDLPKNTDLHILPVIRKTSKDKSKITYRSFHLTLPIKILHKSPMDYYKLANILIAEIIEKWAKLVSLEEGDLDLYLMGRPWLDYDELDSKEYFDNVKCANALNILLENKISDLTTHSKESSGDIKIKNKTFSNQKRSFSTSSKFNFKLNELELDSGLESLDNGQKSKGVKDFKKIYGGGYLGYTHVYNLGNVSQLSVEGSQILSEIKGGVKFEHNLKSYLNEISENVVYSVLPVLKWQYATGEYQSLSISNSIKITRDTDRSLLAERIITDVRETLLVYELRDTDIELLLMSRPWLSKDDFNLENSTLKTIFDGQLEREVSSNNYTKIILEKTSRLGDYEYKDVALGEYGDPVLDKNKNLIGYKINDNKFASVETYYNENNLLSNKISIKRLGDINLSSQIVDQSEPLISWVDIRTDSGFIREHNKNKYYYDKNNKLINVETIYTCPSFPLYKKENTLNDKIGSIDLETYGSNLGMGHHKVYAGG